MSKFHVLAAFSDQWEFIDSFEHLSEAESKVTQLWREPFIINVKIKVIEDEQNERSGKDSKTSN